METTCEWYITMGFYDPKLLLNYVYTYFRNSQSNDGCSFFLSLTPQKILCQQMETKKYRNDDQIGISLFIFSY